MNRERYEFADLEPDVVDEIKLTEKRLSEQTGQPITLIAYRSDAEPDGDSVHPAK